MPELRRGASVSQIESKRVVQGQGTSQKSRRTIRDSVAGLAHIVVRTSSFKKQRQKSVPERNHGRVGFLRKAWSKARWSLLGLQPPGGLEDNKEQPALQRGWDVARHLVHGTGHALQDSKRLMQQIRRVAEVAHHQHRIQQQIMADMQAAFEASLMVPSDGMEDAIGDIISELYSVKMLDLSSVAEDISDVLLEVQSSGEALTKLRNDLLAHLQMFEDFEKELGMNASTVEALVERVLAQVASIREQVLAARSVSAGTECAKPRNGGSVEQRRKNSSVHLPSVGETARYGALPELAEDLPLEMENMPSLEATLLAADEGDAMPRTVRKKRHAGTYDFGSNSERRSLLRQTGQDEDSGRHCQEDQDGRRCAEDSRCAESNDVFRRKMRWRKIQSSSRLLMPAVTRGNLETSDLCDGSDDADAASEENCSESSAESFDWDSEEDEEYLRKDGQAQMRRVVEDEEDEEEQEKPALPAVGNCSGQVTKLSLETSYLAQPFQRPMSRLHIKGHGLLGMPSVACLASKAHRHASMPCSPHHEQLSLVNRRKLVLSAAINTFPAITTITERASEVLSPVSPCAQQTTRTSEVLSPVSPRAQRSASGRAHTADIADLPKNDSAPAKLATKPVTSVERHGPGMPGSRPGTSQRPMAGTRSEGMSAACRHPTRLDGTSSAPLSDMRRKIAPVSNVEHDLALEAEEEEEEEAARAVLARQRPRPPLRPLPSPRLPSATSSEGIAEEPEAGKPVIHPKTDWTTCSEMTRPSPSVGLAAVRPPSKPPTRPNTSHGAGFEMVSPQMRRRRLAREKDEGIAQDQEASCSAAPGRRPRTPEEFTRLRGA